MAARQSETRGSSVDLVEIDVEPRNLQVFVGKSGKFWRHFVSRGGQRLPMSGAINLGDETSVAKHFEILTIANSVGIETGTRHQLGFPGLFAEAQIVETPAQYVGDGNGM